MSQERPLNCVGFVYKELGFKKEEAYIEPPSLKRLRKYFDEVASIEEASVVAVIVYSSDGPCVGHIALISDDKKTITHRGLNSPVSTDPIDEGLEKYLASDFSNRKVRYFKPRKRPDNNLLNALSLMFRGKS